MPPTAAPRALPQLVAVVIPVSLLLLSGCGGGPNATTSTTTSASTSAADGGDGPTTVVEPGSCDPYVGDAESYLGHPVDVMGTGDPCKFYVPAQVELHGSYYWMDVHFETFTLAEDERSASAITGLLGGGLTSEQAPSGWTYAASKPGEQHYVVTAADGTSLHCDASTQPGGGETGTPPDVDPVPLLRFCDRVYDATVQQ